MGPCERPTFTAKQFFVAVDLKSYDICIYFVVQLQCFTYGRNDTDKEENAG